MRGGGLCCLALVLALAGSAAAANGGWEQTHVSTLTIHYRTHDGYRRAAYIVLPDWYGPHDNPPLPLVISPHGRGVSATENMERWGDLPALGPFAVVNPEGQGRRLAQFSWGYAGQIDDLARMPEIVRHAAAFDAVTNMAKRYRDFMRIGCDRRCLARWRSPVGNGLRRLARAEIGGTPRANPRAYAARSPSAYARAIAASGVPLQLW